MVVTFIEICLDVICSTVNGGGGERSNGIMRKKNYKQKQHATMMYVASGYN